MANNVFANGRELSWKSGAGKSICAMPDVCFTPPENPATPPGVPVPYPNTGMASDTTDGSKKVQISGKEVMLKNKSYFKSSTGDEAGSAAKKGLISSKNKGKVYYVAWSMNVKIEGENAVRHLDMTTGNHASPLANAAVPWPFVDEADVATMEACKDDIQKEKTACAGYKPHADPGKDVCEATGLDQPFSRDKALVQKRAQSANTDPCAAARRCQLVEYQLPDSKKKPGINACCPAQTGDHLMPKSSFFKVSVANGEKLPGYDKPPGEYSIDKAPVMCTEGGSCSGTHGLRHSHHKSFSKVDPKAPTSFDAEAKHCAEGAAEVAPQCDVGCIEAQLKAGHKKMGCDTSKPVKHSPTGTPLSESEFDARCQQALTPSPAGVSPGA
jgi:hypothetical protein